jgi:signal transduction histidine kinase
VAALLHRGTSYFALGDYVRAREDFRLASDAVPKEPTVLYNLALADVMVGRWEEAQGLFRTLAGVDEPNGPSYYELLAQTYRAQTEDGFYGQLHRLKNMMGMVGDRLRLFREDASNLLDPGLRASLGELSSHYDLIYHDLVAFLGAVRREPLELDVVDVHQVLDGALVAALPEPVGGGRLEVLKDYAADLPAIVCDPALIREAFLNIILNALEAMQGEGVLSITTGRVASGDEAEEPPPAPRGRRSGAQPQAESRRPAAPGKSETPARPEEFIYVIFVDTGPGVAPEDAERIFHLGYSTKPFGSGIGLYQVRRALAVHGGHVEVTPGGPGAAFTVYLPCRPRLSPSLEDLSPKARLPEDARELIIAPTHGRAPAVGSLRAQGKEEADLLL